MITKDDLLEAIAECQGERNPNASTCIKLAAYYTILNNLQEAVTDPVRMIPQETGYSFRTAPYQSETEFGKLTAEKEETAVMQVMDELMETLRIMHPRLYDAVIRKIAVLD